MKLSVIVPAYNEEKYLALTLKSIRNQTVKSEIIVVANGCTDSTVDIAKNYADRLFVVDKPNVSFARNIGAQHATGDTLVFLDADTRLEPNALEEVSKQFTRNDAVATLFAHPNSARPLYTLIHGIKNYIHKSGWYRGSSGVIITSRALFHNVQGFDCRQIGENSLFIKKVKLFGNYKVIRNTCATTSTRRYERWGLFRTTYFWVLYRWILRRDTRYEAVR